MYEYGCTVTRVVDGDTIDVVLDLGFSILHKCRVRLYGIDTPESRTRDKDEKIRVLQARQAHDHKLELMKEQAPKNYSSGSALHVLQNELSSPANVQPAKKQHAIEEINAHADAVASRALRFKKKKRKKGNSNASKVANDLATSATKSPIREDKNEATNKQGAVATKTSKELPESIRNSLRIIFSIFGGDDKRVEAAIQKQNKNCE